MAEEKEGFWEGLIIGGLMGAALGVFYAPLPGSETREKLQENLQKFRVDSEKAIEEIKENSESLIAVTKTSIEEGLIKLSQAVEEAKKAAEEKRRELEKELE